MALPASANCPSRKRADNARAPPNSRAECAPADFAAFARASPRVVSFCVSGRSMGKYESLGSCRKY